LTAASVPKQNSKFRGIPKFKGFSWRPKFVKDSKILSYFRKTKYLQLRHLTFLSKLWQAKNKNLIKTFNYDVILTSLWRHHDRLCDRRRIHFIYSEIYTKTIKIKVWLQQMHQKQNP